MHSIGSRRSCCRRTVEAVIFACAAAVATIAADRAAAEETKPAESVKITISAPKEAFGPGEQIELQVSLRNSGSEPVIIVQRSVWLNYVLSVTGPDGEALPETDYATKVKEGGAEAGYLSYRQLKPGEEVAEMLDLDKWFEMKKPGLYKVRAQRWVSQTKAFEAPILLGSNELALRIAPLGRGQ